MRIRIQQFTLMRIRIQLLKITRIRIRNQAKTTSPETFEAGQVDRLLHGI
jgi:hypothetical protein